MTKIESTSDLLIALCNRLANVEKAFEDKPLEYQLGALTAYQHCVGLLNELHIAMGSGRAHSGSLSKPPSGIYNMGDHLRKLQESQKFHIQRFEDEIIGWQDTGQVFDQLHEAAQEVELFADPENFRVIRGGEICYTPSK